MRTSLRPAAILLAFSLLITIYLIAISQRLTQLSPDDDIDFEVLNAKYHHLNESGFASQIVPNVVHYIQLDNHTMGFTMYLSIKSVLINHVPDRIFIHCDCERMEGRYARKLEGEPLITINKIERIKRIYGKKISWVQHASDFIRILTLIQFGGIYLDNDMFVIKSLRHFLHFEMTVAWPDEGRAGNQFLGNQIFIAHKDARFLKLLRNSYQDYDPKQWYFNGGELPTKSILALRPDLVHRVGSAFGVQHLANYLYYENHSREEYEKDYYSIHLLASHLYYLIKDPKDIRIFDEQNIRTYNHTFGSMARSIIYGAPDLIKIA